MQMKTLLQFTRLVLISLGILIGPPVVGQVYPQIQSSQDPIYDLGYDEGGEFNFVRVQFDTYYGRGFGYGPWSIDFPDADMNFLRGVSRLTNIRVMSDPIVLRFDDDAISTIHFFICSK